MNIKITRKLLDDYRKIKREIPILEIELEEMKQQILASETAQSLTTGQGRQGLRALLDLIRSFTGVGKKHWKRKKPRLKL